MHQSAFDDHQEERPSRCSTVLYYTWKICTCLFSHVMLVSLVVTYCIMGAFTFSHLEAENELEVKKNISAIRSNVSEDLWLLTERARVLVEENWTRAVEQRLAVFEKELVRCVRADGWDGSEDPATQQWTLSGALFYSIIVITTIGYGHIAPKTHWGKVVTIFYAILGIPLMLLCLSNIGDLMAHSFRFLYWRVCCYACTRRPRRPPPPLRRGRSVRATVRSQSTSGRFSGKSRTQSLRRSARTSQRSADSALALSDCMTRSSYSDAEFRYYDDGDLVVTGLQPGRASTRSRFSDTALQVPAGGGARPSPSPTATPTPTSTPAPVPIEVDGVDPESAARVPVLFNKYALERSESTARRSARRGVAGGAPPDATSAPVSPSAAATLPRNRLAVDAPVPAPTPSPTARRGPLPLAPSPASYPGTPRPPASPTARSAPRVMTPMGFAISRQQSNRSRSLRLQRMREDAEYDDFIEYGYVDYDYEDSYSSGQRITKPVPIWLCVFLVVTYIFCGAYLFHQWEGWHFLDSAYFCFITLTTIGFGDFVPAQHVRNDDGKVSIALCSLYLLFGIALLAMSFNLVQEEVIGNVKSVAKRLGIIKDDEDDDDD